MVEPFALAGVSDNVNWAPACELQLRYCFDPKQFAWYAGPPFRSRQVKTLPLPKQVVWAKAPPGNSSAAAAIAVRQAFVTRDNP